MQPSETVEYNDCVIKIYPDDSAENPIKEFDCQPHVQVWHRHYDFGNDSRFSSPQEFEDFCEDNPKVFCLPIFMYDHSGITVNTSGFSCPWDSGQVGYCWITKEEAKEWWGVEDVEKIEANLRSCVQLLDDYLTGRVYGYIVEDSHGEEVDSCWGFYGDHDKSGLMDEAKGAADHHATKQYKKAMENQVHAI